MIKLKGKNLLLKKKKGEFFGESSLYKYTPRSESVISLTITSLLMISKEEFFNIIKENQQDFVKKNIQIYCFPFKIVLKENYCMTRDLITNCNNYDASDLICPSCNSKEHTLENCKKIHFIPNKEIIIRKFLFSRPSINRKHYKRRIQSFNSKVLKSKVYEASQNFLLRNSDITEFNEEDNEATERDLTSDPIALASQETKEKIDRINSMDTRYSKFLKTMDSNLKESENHRPSMELTISKTKVSVSDFSKRSIANSNENYIAFETFKNYKTYHPAFNIQNILRDKTKKETLKHSRQFKKMKKLSMIMLEKIKKK